MAGTINIANIAIGFDPSKLKAGIDLSRKEINQLNKNMRESLDPVTKMGLEVYQLSEALRVGAIGAERFDAAYEVIAKKFGVITPKAKAEAEALERLALAEKKAADNAAYLDRLKKNSKEMELRNKEKFRDDEERQRIALQQRGLELTKQSRTEMERYSDTVAEYRKQFLAKNISQETYNRLLKEARDGLTQNKEALRKQQDFEREGIALKQQAMTKQERYNSLIREYQRHLHAATITEKEFNILQKQAKQDTFGGGGIAGLSIGRLTAGGIVAGLAYKGISLIQQGIEAATIGSIKLAAELEDSTLSFKVLLDSEQQAMSLLQQMRKLDEESPVNFISIQRAGRIFLGYGLEIQKLMPMLDSLSKISMGNQERFELLSLALAQVAARGKLAGDEVRQMVNQGFNPLLAIAQKLVNEEGGKVTDYMDMLRKKMEEGAISFNLVADAIQDVTNGFGKFANMNTEKLDSVLFKFNKLVSNLQKLGTKIGTELSPFAKEVLDAANFLLDGPDDPPDIKSGKRRRLKEGFFGEVMQRNMAEFLGMKDAVRMYDESRKQFTLDQKRVSELRAKEEIERASKIKADEEAFKAREKLRQKDFDKVNKALEKQREDIAEKKMEVEGEKRRSGMSPIDALVDKEFFDSLQSAMKAFGFNSPELLELSAQMEDYTKLAKDELAKKEKEIVDKSNEEERKAEIRSKRDIQDRKDQFEKRMKEQNNPDRLTSAKTEMLRKDSVEAYNFLVNREDKRLQREEEMEKERRQLQEEIRREDRDLQDKRNKILEDMREDLKNAPRLIKI